MTILKRLFSRGAEPRQRVRICMECGMPVAEHKDWCSILRTLQEQEQQQDTPDIGNSPSN